MDYIKQIEEAEAFCNKLFSQRRYKEAADHAEDYIKDGLYSLRLEAISMHWRTVQDRQALAVNVN